MKMKKMLVSGISMFATAGILMAGEPAESHWKLSGNASLQMTQGYVSGNWYKGGESNLALLASGQFDANYKRGGFAWDNKLEGKLGFMTTPSDEYHSYMTNHDLLKWSTKFGWEASKHWYYTVQGIGQTQFCPGYKSNTQGEMSKFFSPAYLNVAIGMDYKKETENFKITAFVGPLAYNLKFVGDPLRNDGSNLGPDDQQHPALKGKIDGTQFGLKFGQFNTYDYGASAKVNTVWKICKYVKWESVATYYSPLYGWGKKHAKGYTEIQWENTFDMPLNKYFSTKLYTCLRFDDSVGPENKGAGWDYFQFSELLSFGISYNW